MNSLQKEEEVFYFQLMRKVFADNVKKNTLFFLVFMKLKPLKISCSLYPYRETYKQLFFKQAHFVKRQFN